MTNCRFVNCIDISLIFQCVLLPFLSTHFISDLPLLRREAHVLPMAAGTSVCIINSSDYAEEKHEDGTKQTCLFCCIVHFLCTESVIRRYEAILCVGLCLHLLIHALWFRVLFFLMKVPFDMSGPMLRTHSVPHSLLLYSVHVKWILICVQNVDKDENTLDYILCTYLCLRVDSQAECILSLIIYYSRCRWYFQNK